MEKYLNKIIHGGSLEILKTLPSESVDCAITSPPYWALRDYGVAGQLGLEPTFQEYITKLCNIFDEVKRVLKKEGTCWVNLGDSYGSGKGERGIITEALEHKKPIKGMEKSLCQIPSRFAIEMTNRGWILRNEIIWHKPNCMPSSVKDRFTVDFEKVFFFVKSKKYWFETQYEPHKRLWDKTNGGSWSHSVKTSEHGKSGYAHSGEYPLPNPQGRNMRAVWKIANKPFAEAHFATYPEKLIEPMIKAGCPKNGIVLDIFMGAGTTALVAQKLGRNYVGIELNKNYIEIAEKRLAQDLLF